MINNSHQSLSAVSTEYLNLPENISLSVVQIFTNSNYVRCQYPFQTQG